MGCCCSTEDSNSIQDEPNSRTRLLPDPVNNSYQVNNINNDYGSSYGNSAPQKSDDHTALYKVLQQITNKVIDVGALDYQTLEEHEYVERAKVYAQAVNRVHIPQTFLKRKSPMLLMDVSNSEKILSAPPLPQADYNTMISAMKRVNAAVDAIQVTHTEDLVVPFGKG